MSNFIIFMVFIGLLYVVVAGAIGMYLNGERGRSIWTGFVIGVLMPVAGHIFLAIRPLTDKQVLTMSLERNIITKKDFDDIEKTMETPLKK